jgi:hypothetical protein
MCAAHAPVLVSRRWLGRARCFVEVLDVLQNGWLSQQDRGETTHGTGAGEVGEELAVRVKHLDLLERFRVVDHIVELMVSWHGVGQRCLELFHRVKRRRYLARREKPLQLHPSGDILTINVLMMLGVGVHKIGTWCADCGVCIWWCVCTRVVSVCGSSSTNASSLCTNISSNTNTLKQQLLQRWRVEAVVQGEAHSCALTHPSCLNFSLNLSASSSHGANLNDGPAMYCSSVARVPAIPPKTSGLVSVLRPVWPNKESHTA